MDKKKKKYYVKRFLRIRNPGVVQLGGLGSGFLKKMQLLIVPPCLLDRGNSSSPHGSHQVSYPPLEQVMSLREKEGKGEGRREGAKRKKREREKNGNKKEHPKQMS